jgi:hypothetical protein
VNDLRSRLDASQEQLASLTLDNMQDLVDSWCLTVLEQSVWNMEGASKMVSNFQECITSLEHDMQEQWGQEPLLRVEIVNLQGKIDSGGIDAYD